MADTRPDDAPPRRLGTFAAVGVLVLVADQLTKHWAVNRLSGGRMIDVVGSLRLNLLYNTGAAFSLGSGSGLGPWISVVVIGVVVLLALGHTSRFTLGAAAAGLKVGS